jgi:hypothetical protein
MNILFQRMRSSPAQVAPQNGGPQLPPLNFNANGNGNGKANANTTPEDPALNKGLPTIREQSTFSTDSQPTQAPIPDAPSQPIVPNQAAQQSPSNPAPFVVAASDPRRPSPVLNARPGVSPSTSVSALPSQASNSNLRSWSPSVGNDNAGRSANSPTPAIRGTQTPPRPSLDTNHRTTSPLSVRNATPVNNVASGDGSPSHQQLPSIPSLRSTSGGPQTQPAQNSLSNWAAPLPVAATSNAAPNQWPAQVRMKLWPLWRLGRLLYYSQVMGPSLPLKLAMESHQIHSIMRTPLLHCT